ncbi:17839_t:CDS:2, partial [Acaulospora morrowiae]
DDERRSENNMENMDFGVSNENIDKDISDEEDESNLSGEETKMEELIITDSDKETEKSDDNSDHNMEIDNVSSNEMKQENRAQGESKNFSGKKGEEIEEPEPIPLLSRPNVAKQFRDYYMAQMTKAFEEDLDTIRKESKLDSNKIEILKDTLESGISIFSEMEKELALASQKFR